MHECHGHIMLNGADYRAAAALHQSGVDGTAVRDTLAELHRQGIDYFRDGGDALGVSRFARMIAAEYGIDYASSSFAIHKEGLYGKIVGFSYRSMPEFIRLVAQAKADGCDFIKLMFSGILSFEEYGSLSCPSLTAPEIKELVDIVHAEGLRVMAHVNGPDAIRAALEAGTDSIEHGYYMDAEGVRLLAETGAVWVPTLAAVAAFSGRDGSDRQTVSKILAKQKENITAALAAGALVACGSDSGAFGVPHGAATQLEHKMLHEIAAPQFHPLIARANQKIQSEFKQ